MVEDAKAMGGVDLAELYLDRVGNVGLPVDREQVQGTAACLALLLADHTEALLGALLRVLKNQLDDLEDLCVAGVFAARLSGLPPDLHVCGRHSGPLTPGNVSTAQATRPIQARRPILVPRT